MDLGVEVPVGGTVSAPVSMDRDASAPSVPPPAAANVVAPPAPADQAPSAGGGGGGRSVLPWIAFVVAGVGAATGVTLLVLQPRSEATPPAAGLRAVPVVGLGSLGAAGSF